LEESVKRSQSSSHGTEKKENIISSRILKRLVAREVENHGMDAGVSMEAILMATSSVPSEDSNQMKNILTLEE
jgi:hypothetical protein